MKVKGFKEFLKEGLNDLRTTMRSSGQTKEFDPDDFSRIETGFIYDLGGELLDNSTAQISSGEIIKKSSLGYSLEKNGTQLIFIRHSKFPTVPSDFDVFRNQVQRYLDNKI